MKKINKITSSIIVCLAAVFFSTLPKDVSAQTNGQPVENISKATQDSIILAWLEDLNKESVSVTGDSVRISAETSRLLNDESYRQLMYPETYNWETVIYFIQKQDLKKAFWYLVNLYLIDDKNKDIVMKSFRTYDQLFKMDKVLPSVFYTYALTDSEIGSVNEGHFDVTAPHIMEKKLNALKEILFYLDKYRAKDKDTK